MKVIIMGCGRLGAQVAQLMCEDGHDVTVIDADINTLNRLGEGFRGQKIIGIGFDRDVLIGAGIESADAFAATSPSDNANVIAARIARNVFKVPRVVARLYDPRRAEIYQRLGLLTISSTTWGAERIRALLTHEEFDPILTFGSGEVLMLTLIVPYQLVDRMVKHISIPGEIQVVSLSRHGHAMIPLSGTEFQAGDIIHLAILATSMDRITDLFGINIGG
jgi:trk system potassium uptake protein TrkA